jgi:hypothetical protein
MGKSEMLRIGPTDLSARRLLWWQLVIVAAVVSLGFSLATRVCHVDIQPHAGAHSSVAEGMRQHMDRDASHWVAPVPTLTVLGTAIFYPKLAPAGPPIPSVLFDESLSNRPPPPSSALYA